MKQLICEMCGGTDLVKEGGVFVCQTCGCKYSVEEARKLMSDDGPEEATEDYLEMADSGEKSQFETEVESFRNNGIEIETLSCPQCGSSDITMLTETQGACNVCGAQFVAQPSIDNQTIYNVYNINETRTEEPTKIVQKGKMPVMYSHDDFMRKVLIDFVKDDSPLDVFDAEFEDIVQKEHQVLIDRMSAEMSYHVDIGHDREEPYQETEKYFDKDLNRYNTRVVTKYKKVTDWHPLSGSHRTSSTAVVENDTGYVLDRGLFARSFDDTPASLIDDVDAEVAETMVVGNHAKENANADHAVNIRQDLINSLPGDHQRKLDFHITDITDSSETLIIAQEYEIGFNYNGERYTKRAFPFGTMEIGGDDIRGGEKESDALVWKDTKTISFITMALLLMTIAVSFFVHYLVAVIAGFAIGLACFIYHEIKTHKIEKAIKTDYRNQNIEALNEKLKSIGFDPVDPDEL